MSFARRNDAEPRLPPGSVVADAIVERVLAAGATAVVYRGHRPDGRPVAIKVGTAAAASARTEHRFRNESRLSCAVVHPGIVRSIAVGQLDGPAGFEGRMFIIFPFVAGPTLSAEMAYHHEGMPEARVRVIARQLSGALAALHAAGIVHRYIKPANLILGEEDGLHLVDFGLAYALGTSGVEKTDDVTLKGAAPGTTYYMSPQQLMHAEVSAGFDVFGFGATLFELLCGWAPEAEQSEDEVAARRRAGDWAPPRLVATGVSEELAELVTRCLAREVDARPSVDALVAFFAGMERSHEPQALAVVERAPDLRPDPQPDPEPEPDSPSRDGVADVQPVSGPSRQTVVLVAVLLLGLSFGLWFAFSARPREPGGPVNAVNAVDAVRDVPAPAAVVGPDRTPKVEPGPEVEV